MKNQINLDKIKKNIQKDCDDFVIAMTRLAQGQVNTSIDNKLDNLEKVSLFNREYVSIINLMIDSFKRAEAEFNKITDIQSKRLVYVGGDLYLQGKECCRIMAELIGGKGKVAITTGHLNSTGLELRRKGFRNGINEEFSGLELVEIHENNEDPNSANEWFHDLYKRHPDIKGIYITEGATPWGIGKAVLDLDLRDKVTVIAHDMADDTIDYINKGAIAATANDNTYIQGYDPVIHLYNKIAANWNPGTAQQLVKMDLVTQSNLSQFWNGAPIQSQESLERLVKPMESKSGKKVKIGVVCRDESDFWHVVKKGVMDAANSIKSLGAEVNWYEVTDNFIDSKPYEDLIGKAIDDGCNAIATIVINSNMVPYINSVVDKGIPVATFVTEPTSLRNLLFELNNQSENIEELTHVLRSHQEDSFNATNNIISSVKDISQGTDIQTTSLTDAQSKISSLKKDIEEINSIALESSKANSKSVRVVNDGSKSVETSLTNIKQIEDSITRLWHSILSLSEESKEITKIVDIISNITEQINILSINAAIESARAGEEGKGFLVISGEIRKLANETGKATTSISGIIERIKEDTAKASMEIEVGKDYITRSSKISDTALIALKEIKSNVEDDSSRGESIALAISRINDLADKVEDSMNSLSQISISSSDSIHSMSESLDIVGEKLKNVDSLVIELEKIAVAGKTIMSNFTII